MCRSLQKCLLMSSTTTAFLKQKKHYLMEGCGNEIDTSLVHATVALHLQLKSISLNVVYLSTGCLHDEHVHIPLFYHSFPAIACTVLMLLVVEHSCLTIRMHST